MIGSLSMAEAQAVGLCWLSRQSGLPVSAPLRTAAAQLHPGRCGWCDYPAPALLGMLGQVTRLPNNGVTVGLPDGIGGHDEREWWALPARARMAALRAAQGEP